MKQKEQTYADIYRKAIDANRLPTQGLGTGIQPYFLDKPTSWVPFSERIIRRLISKISRRK